MVIVNSVLYLKHFSLAIRRSDHDFAENNSDGDSDGAPAAATVFRSHVPHPSLPADARHGGGDMSVQAARSVHYAFSIGRVRFLVTDLRSQRSSVQNTAAEHRTLMGEEQLQWFKAELLHAAQEHVLLIWVCEFPWAIGDRKWGWFENERQDVLSFVATHGLRHKMLILSGDAHMLAIDDGRFSPGGIPVLHASPLARMGSYKGGPYAYGAVAVDAKHGQGAYGLLTISDNGLDMQRTNSARDLESFQDSSALERKRQKRSSITQRVTSKIGMSQAAEGDASVAVPPARAGRDALALAADSAKTGSVLPLSRLASTVFSLLGLNTGDVVSSGTAALAAVAGSSSAALAVAQQGGVSHHLEGGGARPAHVATATPWTGVCITARGIVSDGTAVRNPAGSAGRMAVVANGSPLSVAGELLRWDTCHPQTSSQLAPHYPPLTKPGEWAPLYAYAAQKCTASQCDVDSSLPASHPLSGVPCPALCLQAVKAGSTFSGWEIKQSAPSHSGLLARAVVVEQQHLVTAAAWLGHWFLTPLAQAMTYIMSPLHTYSQRVRLIPDTSAVWLQAYYTGARAVWSSKAGDVPGVNVSDAKLALPWLTRRTGSNSQLHFVALRDLAPDFDAQRVSLGFYDLHRASLRSLGGAVGVGELLLRLLEETRSSSQPRGQTAKWLFQQHSAAELDAPFTNASFVTRDGRRLEAARHSSLSHFRLRAAGALDAWTAFDPRSASATFTVVFMGCVLLCFVAVQGVAGFCAIHLLPRMCCASRQVAQAGEDSESAEAAAYNEWYSRQQMLAQQRKAAAAPGDSESEAAVRHRAGAAGGNAQSSDHTPGQKAAGKNHQNSKKNKKRQ